MNVFPDLTPNSAHFQHIFDELWIEGDMGEGAPLYNSTIKDDYYLTDN